MAEHTRIVVVGGGAVGCGVAFQLAEAGVTDVLVLEKEPQLCAVTSAQAAGLVGQVRSTVERTRLAMRSVATFTRLEREGSEVKPGWRQTGSLRLAQTQERVAEFERLLGVAREAGLEAELMDAAAARRLWPQLDFGAALAILWCPSDGYLQPADLVASYQHHARRKGVRFRTGTRVTGVRLERGRVAAVETDHGEIACETVINAAGAHGYHVGRLVGLELPVFPVRHHYVITTPTDWIGPDMPCLRAPDATLYGRPDVNALLLGGWEPEGSSLDPRSYGLDGEPPPIEHDWPVLAGFMEQFRPFAHDLADQPVRHVFTGWPTFTPDGRFIVGESARVPGFVCAVGCNAHGVSGSAGIGRHVVEALTEPEPSAYVQSLSPDRFTETPAWDWGKAERRARHVLETYYHVGH